MIILTGFEPFGNHNVNPSWEIVKELEDDDTKIYKIPVSFEKAKKIPAEILMKNVNGVISIGYAPSRAQISVEAVAINLMDSMTPDNEGYTPSMKKIYEDGAPAYFSTVPPHEVVGLLKSKGIPSYVSHSAGTYVCNTLFYSFLYFANKNGLQIPICFVHIPPTENIALNKPNLPYVQKDSIVKAIETMIDFIYRHLSSP